MFTHLKSYLQTNFEKMLFEAAMENLNSNSRIRFSNFSFVMRELIDVVLERLAPDSLVMKTSWYEKPKDLNRNVSRKQRLKYIIQKEYDDIYFQVLEFDIKAEINALNQYHSLLSENTHLSEKCFNYSEKDIQMLLINFVDKINSFISLFDKLKDNIYECLELFLFDDLKNAFFDQTFDDLDILSTHTFVDNWDISSIEDIEISNNVFSGSFVGTVSVILQYGSDRERQIGDGMVSYDTYDFSSNFSFEIPNIQEIMHQMNLNVNNYKNHISVLKETFIREVINIIEIEEPNINTSSFYK